MNRRELRATLALAAVVALRLFGLFLILPVFAVYAADLAGATPLLIGVALGIYGLTQGSLQVPLGWLSDRVGRKPVIAAGLLVFVLGSVLAAVSTSIWGVIAGRALQGGGAIAGAAMALAADVSREQQRSRVMAVIGTTIGAAFALAMVLGPVFGGLLGLDGLFWLIAVLGVVSLGLLFWVVPDAKAAPVAGETGGSVRGAWRRVADWCIGVFLLHGLLTALFVVLPVSLARETGLPPAAHWRFYLPALVIAGVVSMGAIFFGRERHAPFRIAPGVALMATGALILAAGLFGWGWVLLALVLFFTGFTLLEATLPALMSYSVPAERRGVAMGLYAGCQFLGAFCGGLAGGAVRGAFGERAVFELIVAVGVLWLVVSILRTGRWLALRTA